MRIELRFPVGEKALLPVVSYLEATKESVSSVPERGLRHPLSAYNVSAGSAIFALSDVVSQIEKLSPLVTEAAADAVTSCAGLKAATTRFLQAYDEHLDACQNVLCAYIDESGKKNRSKALREFKETLGSYGKHISVQANHIKHRQCTVRLMSLYAPPIVVPAYYVEGVVDTDAIGPDPVIHGNSNTAFSYAREIRLAVCGLFYISRCVLSTLERYVGHVTWNSVSETDGLMSLVERVSYLPIHMLPDEYSKPRAYVAREGHNFHISYGQVKQRIPYGTVRFKVAFQGDGVTRSFKMPYFGTEKD